MVVLPVLAFFGAGLITNDASAANHINSIDKTVTIERNGDATVEEVWMMSLDSGTEVYETFSDLRGKTISDLIVSDENGREYTTVGAWNTSWGFQEKAFKAGYNFLDDGVELCFGISQYGNRTYVFKYKIHDLVTKYSDFPGIYFDFLNMDMSVFSSKVTLKMADGTPLSTETARMWAFGYEGTDTFMDDGTAVFQPSRYLTGGEHIQILMFFGNELFDELNITSELSSDDVFEGATFESEYTAPSFNYAVPTYAPSTYRPNSITHTRMFSYAIMAFALIFIVFGMFTWIPTLFARVFQYHKTEWFVDKFEAGKRLSKMKDIPASNIIPCDGDLALMYYLMHKFDIGSEKERRKGLLGARILEYAREKQVSFKKETRSYWLGKKEEYVISVKQLTLKANYNDSLANLLINASGGDDILNRAELKKYCKKHFKSLDAWFDQMLRAGENRALEKGLITPIQEDNNWFHFRSAYVGKRYFFTHYANEEAERILALKKYLLNFSTVTREIGAQEVVIWERYLIFATLVGIADKVREQLKIHYPEVLPKMDFGDSVFSMDVFTLTDDLIQVGMMAAAAGIAAEARKSVLKDMGSIGSSSFSGGSGYGGGGGSSSFSGGGSSGGSSGGGVR